MKFTTFLSAGAVVVASLQPGTLAAKQCTKRDVVPIYGQCGGISYSGSKTCATGSTCVYSNPWYSQCQPSPVNNLAVSTDGAVALWGQCGGMNYAGSKTCVSGSTCVYSNPYYSQCLPASADTTPVATTPVASTDPATTVPGTTTPEAPATPETSSTPETVSTTTPAPVPQSSPTSTPTTAKATVTTSKSSAAAVTTSVPNTGYTPVSGIYPLGASKSAIATTYGGNWPGGMCSFSDYPHVGLNGVALGKQQWFGAAGCGACIKITGASGSVIAMVNDQCPECVDNHLDLDESYGAQVDVNFRTKGIFDITWEFVTCPVSGNLQFKNKEGTSAYYFALQVRNSVLPIDTLEVSTNGGASWTNVHREDYNFFTSYSGFGDVVDVRVTSTTGQQIIERGIKVSSGSIVQGTQQFSA